MVRTPLESLVFAYAALIPIFAGGVAVWVAPGPMVPFLLRATVTWSAAVLCFLAGVRRGLSFRQEGGPTVTQIASIIWLFVLGAAPLFSPWMLASTLLLMAGYGSMLVLDPVAARHGEAPRYFARLRPPQLLLLLAGLASLLVKLLAV